MRPSRRARRIWEVDPEELWGQGIRGLILDLDNTLVDWNRTELRPEVSAWFETARGCGLKLCLVSNAFHGKRVQAVARELGIPEIKRAGKPFARAFRRGMAQLGTTPGQTCVFGDQVFTDMLGANRLGIMTVLLEPLSPRESPHTRLIRLIERPLRRRWGR